MIITTNRDLHEKIAQHLLTVEEMLQEDFDAFFE
jgi:ATP-dependent Zn protease